MKRKDEELFGVNTPLLRLIINGQFFNPSFLHPMDTLEEANDDSAKCHELLEQWLEDAEKVNPCMGITDDDQR